MRHLVPILLLVCGLSSGGSGHGARATVLRGMDLQTLCDTSTEILRGQVVRLAPQWQGGRILTAVTLRVEAPLLGNARSGDSVTFWTLGGEVGGLGQRVVGEVRFRDGERVVVFLERRAGRLMVSGMVQGKFRVLAPSLPGEPTRVLSSVGGFTLSGGGHPLRRPITLADFEAQVRALVKTRAGALAPAAPGRRP